jgi:hypothetical protein
VDRITIQKSTGKIIEYQSGDSDLGTLTQNAINSGYDEADVEEKYISQEAYKTLSDAEIEASLTYTDRRKYAPTGDQLDMLWHSIDAGEFGDTAKQSEFYIANKAVKDANPKG